MTKVAIADKSTQATTTTQTSPIGNRLLAMNERGGHVKAYPFTYTNNTGGALADGSYVQLCTVGPGRILPNSTYSISALGASRVLNLGWQDYTNQDNVAVVHSANGLMAAKDVSSAVNSTLQADGTAAVQGAGYMLQGNADIIAQVTGGTIPAAATISGIIYVVSD